MGRRGKLEMGSWRLLGALTLAALSAGCLREPTTVPSPVPEATSLPSLAVKSRSDARKAVVRIEAQGTFEDPAEGTLVPAGTEIGVVVARGRTAVPVPDIRNVPEAQALQVIVDDGLSVGTRTTAFDPSIAKGNVISQQPGAGIIVAPGTPVDYVVSDGPEPTPTPTVAPTPTPTAAPTPTPKPTPTPTAPPVNVGQYTCKTVEVATTDVDADGLGSTVVSDPAGTDRRIDKEILQIADGRQQRRAFVNDVVRNADHFAIPFGNDRIDGRAVIEDTRPRMLRDRLGRLAFVKTRVTVPQLTPPRFVARFDSAYRHRHRFWLQPSE